MKQSRAQGHGTEYAIPNGDGLKHATEIFITAIGAAAAFMLSAAPITRILLRNLRAGLADGDRAVVGAFGSG